MSRDVARLQSFRNGANAVRTALLILQEKHGLTDLEMVSVLNEHERSILSDMVREQHTVPEEAK